MGGGGGGGGGIFSLHDFFFLSISCAGFFLWLTLCTIFFLPEIGNLFFLMVHP